MPPISEFKCDKCGFELPTGWGFNSYVTDKNGKRVTCSHPGEVMEMSRVLEEYNNFDSLSKKEGHKIWDEKTGINTNCLCLQCLHKFDLDFEKDNKVCPKCKSKDIKSIFEMIDQPCPKCKKGNIRAISTGWVA